jgi:hypothetical protein
MSAAARNAPLIMETSTMWRETSALLCAAVCLAVGCGTKEGAAGSTSTSEEAIGVAECDDYFKKMNEFTEGLPEEARAARAPGLKAMRDAWREAARTPAGKDSLKATCKEQLHTLGPNGGQ